MNFLEVIIWILGCVDFLVFLVPSIPKKKEVELFQMSLSGQCPTEKIYLSSFTPLSRLALAVILKSVSKITFFDSPFSKKLRMLLRSLLSSFIDLPSPQLSRALLTSPFSTRLCLNVKECF